MRTNIASVISPIVTHEGATAKRITPVQQLRRSVMSCMLFEGEFYEDGQSIATRIHADVHEVLKSPNGADIVGNIAYEARTKFKLRHAPLWLVIALIQANTTEAKAVVAGAIAAVIQRPDELAELIAMYWKEGKKPLTNQMKRGLREAFGKFDRYSLSKYANRDGQVAMRDVMFLVHPKPKDEEQTALWKDLADKSLTAPDTWESQLSGGADKKEVFQSLIAEGKLGALALLRNLRGMIEAKVDVHAIRGALASMKTERVLPFRFITAAKYAPSLEPELESAMFRCIEESPKLMGTTTLIVDGSGSMFGTPVSAKSEIDRFDAACALAMLIREVCEHCNIIVYSTNARMVQPRRGFALRDVLKNNAERGGTNTRLALQGAEQIGYDRCIVITDEQSATAAIDPITGSKGYFVNVASARNGIGYGKWVHIDGWSESIIDYITQYEQQ